MKTHSVAEHETLQTQKQIEEKKEQARRLLKGGTLKNKAKAVELLEDCVALGDADSMLTLAKCYVLGCGIEQNTERAENLLSECAMKGNREAMLLIKFNKDWKGQDIIDLKRLLVSLSTLEQAQLMFFGLLQTESGGNAQLRDFSSS